MSAALTRHFWFYQETTEEQRHLRGVLYEQLLFRFSNQFEDNLSNTDTSLAQYSSTSLFQCRVALQVLRAKTSEVE